MGSRLIRGHSQIYTDTIVFRHGEKVFELPIFGVVGKIAHYNGYFYEAKLKDIKKYLKEHGHG